MEPKKLYRNEYDKQICGVCSGVAEYFNIDVSIVRILWAVAGLFGGTGIVLYFVAAFILPAK